MRHNFAFSISRFAELLVNNIIDNYAINTKSSLLNLRDRRDSLFSKLEGSYLRSLGENV